MRSFFFSLLIVVVFRIRVHESDGESQAAAKSPLRTQKTNGSTKRRDSTSDSADENHMVDFFEEDFDSNDEDHKKLHSATPRPPKPVDSAPVQSDSAPSSPRSPPEPPPTAVVQKSKIQQESAIRIVSEGPTHPPEEQLDSWLDSLEAAPVSKPKDANRNHLRLSESSEEGGGNPLVAKFEDIASESVSEEESRDGSTSRSTSGFTVVKNKQPPIVSSFHPCNRDGSV